VSDVPVLWHIKVSHFSEKVRWALDYKRVDHRRRTPLPGAHPLFALWLTRGAHATLPVLELDGERIGDSTRIIEALERRDPEPALYPEDVDQRARALELEEFFDEQVGPQLRRFVWHEAIKDREAFEEFAVRQVPGSMPTIPRLAGSFASTFVRMRYGAANEEGAEAARHKVLAGLDRVEVELGSGDYLVGDRFTVADLAGAALLYPLVLPPDGPTPPLEPPEPFRQFQDSVRERRAVQWVAEMFRRHRGNHARDLRADRAVRGDAT
jgi:glutathione S-transferase